MRGDGVSASTTYRPGWTVPDRVTVVLTPDAEAARLRTDGREAVGQARSFYRTSP